ncbi:hypothetical protein SAMD00019534_112160, partial [Acytostelium subglobosum LB1]|uniref:hypothetical protein n=1 Tax=Acytostelium subglobosum LB1 TaxID=1410327 RepID=UPI000644ADBA
LIACLSDHQWYGTPRHPSSIEVDLQPTPHPHHQSIPNNLSQEVLKTLKSFPN